MWLLLPMRLLLQWSFWIVICSAQILEITSVSEILNQPYTLLYFHAPDCMYCNAFDPDFVYLNELYKGNDELAFAKVNGREETQMADLFEVKSFPTIKLYDTKLKKIAHFGEKRTLSNLETFIQDFSGAIPDEASAEMLIELIKSVAELDNLAAEKDNILIALVSKRSHEWLKYYYPNHFYQDLSKGYPDVTFSIVFADETGGDIMERYEVSNFPSLLLVSPKGIKTFNTFSTNSMTNNNLDGEDIQEFLSRPGTMKESLSFASLDELKLYIASESFEGHKQIKPGMNVVQAKRESLGVDSEYEDLMRHMEL